MKRFGFWLSVGLAGGGFLAACSAGPSGPPPNVPPTAIFSLDPDSGAAPLAVRLQLGGQDSDGTVVRYRLELTGATSLVLERTVPIDTLITLTQGTYALNAEIEDDAGATVRSAETVQVTEPPNQPPVPALHVAPVSGELPLQVTATGGGTDPDGTVAGYALDMDGDGLFEADSTGPLTRTRRFEAAGTFWVRLRLTDDEGAVARDSVQVTVLAPNQPPSGSLEAASTSGDAPLHVQLNAAGQDPDGQIVRWEIDLDDGRGFVDMVDGGQVEASYGFNETAYRPRLRLTDDRGARTVVEGPEILVFRPIRADVSSVSVIANSRFASLAIAPAIWADGQDAARFTITVRDGAQQPLAGVPIRVRSLRPPLVTPSGQDLGETLSISLDAATTDAQGVVTGSIITLTSSRVDPVPQIAFLDWTAMVEADAGHGDWRRLPDVPSLNSETVVSGTGGHGKFFVQPQGLVCVGTPVQIKIQAIRRNDAPSPGQPASDMYAEVRYDASGDPVAATPAAGYADWRTDGAGWIVFDFTSAEPDFKTLKAWVDGMPLALTTGFAFQNC